MKRSTFSIATVAAPVALLVVAAMLRILEPAAAAATGDCGVPVSQTQPKTSDCLYILNAAVQLRSCLLCTCDVNDSSDITASDALLCLKFAVGQDVTLHCPSCTGAAGCPVSVRWTTRGGFGATCVSNDDCSAGACDTSIGLCRTASELDLGWTGKAHDIALDDGSSLMLSILCNGSDSGCGQCQVEGVDASAGNCRCANDSRSVCSEPFATDHAQCPACSGGAFDGRSCSDDTDCNNGACALHCALAPDTVCTTNTDCPKDARPCAVVTRCGSDAGKTCSTNAECAGTCSGAAACACYEETPIPVASVDFPFCVVPELVADVTGTIDVDSGASGISKKLELLTYEGDSLALPCPICGGSCTSGGQPCTGNADCGGANPCVLDATAGDGHRDGTCIGGANDGRSCDVTATNRAFPAGGGAGYSLDCLPDPSSQLGDFGVPVLDFETTGTASLAGTLPCDPFTGRLCPCLVCSGHADLVCHADSDCAGVKSCASASGHACNSSQDCTNFDLGTCTVLGNTRCSGATARTCSTNSDCQGVDLGPCDASTCSASGPGTTPLPNSCSGSCTDEGNGEGTCSGGPNDTFCDGLLMADGTGIRACASNFDCSVDRLGFDAGACSLVQSRKCFLDPIVATGAPDPSDPLVGATFCVPPTSSIGANTSIGLPGPARIRRQGSLVALCAGDPAAVYVPGSNSCP
ncbi:MAG TPA: hypothetical protein VGK20_17820 [Candidatus Binatia bacterium]